MCRSRTRLLNRCLLADATLQTVFRLDVTVRVNVKSRLLADAMALNARLLKMAGVSIADATSEAVSFSGVPLAFGPMVPS